MAGIIIIVMREANSSSSSSSSITSNHRRGKRIRVQAFQGGLLLGCEALKGGKGIGLFVGAL